MTDDVDETTEDPRERRCLDGLAALARDTSPPPIDAAELEAMIERAVDESSSVPAPREEPSVEHSRRRPAAARWIAFGVAAAALLAVGTWIGRTWTGGPAPAPRAPELALAHEAPEETHAAAPAAPSQLRLPTGDVVTATAGAAFSMEESGPARRFRVDRGGVGFDVRPLGTGERFEVVTPDLSISVIGTVFTVEARDEGSIVRVYEGRVAVTDASGVHHVSAGGTFRRGAAPIERDQLSESAARAAAARRAPPVATLAASPPAAAERSSPSPPESPRAAGGAPQRAAVHPAELAVEQVGLPEAPAPAAALAWIARGEPTRALDLARRMIARGQDVSAWRMVEGDALRATGRFADAVVAYERAGEDGAYRIRAGYLVATVRAEHLGDATGALDALARSGATAEGSALAERSLILEHRLATRLGRRTDAERAASTYLARYPHGPHADALRTEVARSP